MIDNWDMANEYTHNNDGGEKSYWDEVYYPDYEYSKKNTVEFIHRFTSKKHLRLDIPFWRTLV